MTGVVYVIEKLGDTCQFLEAQLAQARERIAELEASLTKALDE